MNRGERLALAVLGLSACDVSVQDEGDDTDVVVDGTFTDANGDGISESTVAVSQCSESYVIPGPFGSVLDGSVQPHQAVFGGAQSVLRGGDVVSEVGPTPSQVHLGWPGEDTSTSIAFVWNTDAGTLASQVQIGRGADLDPAALTTTLDGVTYRYGGSTGDEYRVHELKLCGRLLPATVYSYRVGGEGHWSKVYTFTTPGAPDSFTSFRAVFLGDSRGSYEKWGEVVAMAAAESPDLFVFSGDAVELGSNQWEWLSWWDATGDVFAERVIVPAHGNHESLVTNYFAQISMPGAEHWFTLRYGSLALVVLNDTSPNYPTDIAFDQVTFMEEHLDTDALWTAAVHHKTAYTVSTSHDADSEVFAAWPPAFDGLGLDFVLAGHNHLYERSKPLRDNLVVGEGEGTVYVVSGGAGAELYTGIGDAPFKEVAEAVHHYVVVDFDESGAQFTVKSLDGDAVDSFELPAN